MFYPYIPLLTELERSCLLTGYKHLAPTELQYSSFLRRTDVGLNEVIT
jgi:hypothetical protein